MEFEPSDSMPKFTSYLYSAALTVAGLGALALSMLYVYQEKLLYMPNPPGMPRIPEENPPGCVSPAEWKLDGGYCEDGGGNCDPIPFEDVTITTDDGERIHAWLLLQPNISAKVPTLLYFHGNAGNMGFRLQNAASMFGQSRVNVLMMDYRGFGKSTGKPTEKGLQLDAVAVMKYVRQHPKLIGSPVVPFGRSLGGAVATWLAYHHPSDVHGVIIENSFLSVGHMVDTLMPWVAGLKWLVLRMYWSSIDLMPALKQPILFISGDRDELVPPAHMQRLHEASKNSVYTDMFIVPGGSHNDTWARAGRKYYMRLRMFAEKVVSFHTNGATAAPADGSCSSTSDASFPDGESEGNVKGTKQVHLPTMTKRFGVK